MYGRPDVLLRTNVPSAFGAWAYEVADTKLARETRGGTILQLGLYCEMLARSIKDIKELSDAGLDALEELPLLEERPGTQVDLPLPCFIPAEYVEDPVLRLELLRDLHELFVDIRLNFLKIGDLLGRTNPRDDVFTLRVA